MGIRPSRGQSRGAAKSLLLGAAAGFVALTGAQAADLPGKAAPAEYVRICDTYGAGFFFIPGTDTCLRIGGYVRADFYVAQAFGGATNVYSTRSRVLLNFDARSNTEYGLLRAYGEFFIQRGPANAALPFTLGNTGQGATVQASAAYMSRAFIQFAGFTFGNSASFFNFYQGDVQFVGGGGAALDASRQSSNLIAYTASFGSGFSATVSIEDPQFRRIGSLPTFAAATGTFTAAAAANGVIYNGNSLPDVVANLRVDQGWGSAQIMAAYHEVRTNTNALVPAASASAAGWAVGGGVRLNLDMLARGDVLWLQAAYADGALAYVFTNDNSDGISQTRQTQAVGILTATYADGALNAAGTGIRKSTAWGVFGGFRHFWTPALRSALWGRYVAIDSPSVNTQGASLNDIRYWAVGANTVWSPVRNLDLGVEIVYQSLSSRTNAGGFVAPAVSGARTTGSASAWSGMLRVQRNF
ncbi:porin [Phreatobacter sp.]|uniref:porin n=1 Tax=Phreatobacter sp. TaxID=1966341 RepID=UPI0025EAC945|nr:porin [Phreatobacter sp.]